MPKTNPQRLAGLTAEEKKNFDMLICNLVNKHMGTDFTVAIRESLSRSRALSNEARDLLIWWMGCDEDAMRNCSKFRKKVLTLVDAIAAELAETKGE